MLLVHAAALILTFRFLALQGNTWREAFGLEWPSLRRHLPLVLGGVLLILPVLIGISAISGWVLSFFSSEVEAQLPVEMLRQSESLGEWATLALVAVVTAPIAEEILFRGILFRFVRDLGYESFAWWGTSILFALSHFHTQTFVSLAVLSLFLNWLYVRSGNLLVPITAHACFNACNVMMIANEAAIRGWLESLK